MSSKAKHMARSHRDHTEHARSASIRKGQATKIQREAIAKKSLKERIANLFRKKEIK